MNQVKVNIFSFYYKPGPKLIYDECYINVWAGKNKNNIGSDLIGDDTGENISDKNKYFSELTGIYWAWKNCKTPIVGTCHYRRYFTPIDEPFLYRLKRLLYFPLGLYRKRFGLIYTKNIKFWEDKIITANEVIEILENHDAIMPLRRKFKYSIKEHFRRYHNLKDLDLMNQVLEELYPEYISSLKKILEGNRLFANNMFILKYDMFNKLMEWLFQILFEIEKRTDLTNYQDYQQRIFGFLSERLITLWVYHNKIKYKELPLVYFKKLKEK